MTSNTSLETGTPPMTASYHDILHQAPSLAGTAELAANLDIGDIDADRPWVFVGCGASFHAATAAAALFTALANRPGLAIPASDLWMNPDVWLHPHAVVVGLSRTGTTTETAAALKLARSTGATTIGISLTANTPVIEEADHGLTLDHVDEHGRVMTRSFSNLLLACQMLVARAATLTGGRNTDQALHYRNGITQISDAVAHSIQSFDHKAHEVAKIASPHVVFLGSGPDIAVCRQAALQTQETARSMVEAHTVLDYRHGPLATLTPASLLVLLTSDRSLPADLVIAEDVATLGGSLVVVGPAGVTDRFPSHVTKVPHSSDLPRWLHANVALPFTQLLAYHLTIARGADPESVHNLDRTRTPHVNPHVLNRDMFDGSGG